MAFNQFEIARKIAEIGPYRTGSAAGVAFTLTKPTDKKRKFDGAVRWEQIGSITIHEIAHIGRTSPNLLVAANRAISVCLKKGDPQPTMQEVQAMDEEVLQRRIKEGVDLALKAMNLTPEDLAMLQTVKKAREPRRKKAVT